MSTKKSTVAYIEEQIASAGEIRSRAMFGEYGIYCDDKMFGVICDDELFIKYSPISDSYLDSSHISPPFPGAKNYLKVPAEKWEDREWLCEFVKDTTAHLPEPTPRKRSPRQTSKLDSTIALREDNDS